MKLASIHTWMTTYDNLDRILTFRSWVSLPNQNWVILGLPLIASDPEKKKNKQLFIGLKQCDTGILHDFAIKPVEGTGYPLVNVYVTMENRHVY